MEVTLGLEEGFWNLVANGATFKSLGRRQTKPGRQLIAALEAMLARWRALPTGEELVVEWPTRRLPSAGPRVRERRPSGVRGEPPDPDLACSFLMSHGACAPGEVAVTAAVLLLEG